MIVSISLCMDISEYIVVDLKYIMQNGCIYGSRKTDGYIIKKKWKHSGEWKTDDINWTGS